MGTPRRSQSRRFGIQSAFHSADSGIGLLRVWGSVQSAFVGQRNESRKSCNIVTHGESVYHNLRLLESIALDISSLLATEVAAVKREKEEINSRMSTIFAMHRGALHVLEGRLADLHCIGNLWREARDLLSLGIHAFNGVQSDLAALSEHQTGPKIVCLHVPASQQDLNFKGWVRRLKAQRVLMPAGVP